MQNNIIKYFILPTLFIVIFSTIYYQRVQLEIDKLINERYTQTSQQIKSELSTLIQEKQENILAISLAVSQHPSIHNILLKHRTKEKYLQKLSSLYKNATSMKNIWFQVISKDGVSLHRSWSEKSGDSLLGNRAELKDMLDYPRVISTISVGKFSITYKAIVPVYYKNEFIGIFETIAHLHSVSKKIKQKGAENILLIDKKYKKQLIYAPHSQFIDDYYVVDTKVDSHLFSHLKRISPQTILYKTNNNYLLSKEENILISSFTIKNYLGDTLGYFILFQNLDDIDTSDIELLRNNVILLFGVILLIIYIFIYYSYKKMKQSEVEKKNRLLEENIEKKNSVLKYISLHDSLTSLPNREHFKQKLSDILKNKNSASSLYIMHIGIDKLKEINDAYGHDTGDKVIRNIAKTLQKSIGDNTLTARLTADEFAVAILLDKELRVDSIADKLLNDTQVVQNISGKLISVTVSIGLSQYSEDFQDPKALLHNANTAMYKAKTVGGNNYQFYTREMTSNLLDKLKLDDDLKKAIQNNEFEPYFQAQIDTQTNSVVGMEGLIRWIHPKLGIIYPDRFIPYAEESGLIVQIDRIMMRNSMEIIMSWEEEYSSRLKLSLNLSAINLESENFIEDLKESLIATNFNAKNLELEMLESQIMKDHESSILLLHELRSLGISISIDDFGTGYSSLSYLKKLSFDTLKIDREFIKETEEKSDDSTLLTSILDIGKHFNYNIVIEGVETKVQKDTLLKIGHKLSYQGYYLSRPLGRNQFREKFLI